jgi:glutathione S-transferase
MITVTHLKWVPPFAQGLTRDLRVRWALEEAGLPYRMRQLDFPELSSPEHRARQPFAQGPAFEEDGLVLFESGAIALHIAGRSPELFPPDANGRARATAWVFAALNTMEPVTAERAGLDFFYADEPWAETRRPAIEEAARRRLADLAGWLGDRDWLEDRFTVGDLMMTTVLRQLRHTDLIAEQPALAAYVARCEARPAFVRAERDHLAAFERRTA